MAVENNTVRQINCIICPLSCAGEIICSCNEVIETKGFNCLRGADYAREEISNPKRTLTTTIRVASGELPSIPVVSQSPLPKDKVLACARYLSNKIVFAPISEGEVVCHNILNLGIDIIVTRNLKGC